MRNWMSDCCPVTFSLQMLAHVTALAVEDADK